MLTGRAVAIRGSPSCSGAGNPPAKSQVQDVINFPAVRSAANAAGHAEIVWLLFVGRIAHSDVVADAERKVALGETLARTFDGCQLAGRTSHPDPRNSHEPFQHALQLPIGEDFEKAHAR